MAAQPAEACVRSNLIVPYRSLLVRMSGKRAAIPFVGTYDRIAVDGVALVPLPIDAGPGGRVAVAPKGAAVAGNLDADVPVSGSSSFWVD